MDSPNSYKTIKILLTLINLVTLIIIISLTTLTALKCSIVKNLRKKSVAIDKLNNTSKTNRQNYLYISYIRKNPS
jgi:hypothetical protein